MIAAMPENRTEPRDGHPLVARVEKNIRAKGLLAADSRVLVSVSGGPDSIGLLNLLVTLRARWRFVLHVLHINHQLRGEESEEDALFVKECCHHLAVTFHQRNCPIQPSERGLGGASVQKQAREARYTALSQVGLEVGAQRIALGHTADDQAETVLMWMIRGAGARGLAGMPVIREERYVRPLLSIRRPDILAYLHHQNIPFRVDSSNANVRYVRNHIRHQLIPLLEKINPRVVTVLTRQAELTRDEDRFLDGIVKKHLERLKVPPRIEEVKLPRAEFLRLEPLLQRRMIREIVRRMTDRQSAPGFKAVSSILRQVIDGPTGASCTIQGVQIMRVYADIQWRKEKGGVQKPSVTEVMHRDPNQGLSLDVPGFRVWPSTGEKISARLFSRGDLEWQRLGKNACPPTQALFDANHGKGHLQIRNWVAGDRFCPLGMGGKQKKLQDFFTDLKVPRAFRHDIPLVVGQEGILWVVGYRIDQRFIVTPSTQTILCLEVTTSQSSS